MITTLHYLASGRPVQVLSNVLYHSHTKFFYSLSKEEIVSFVLLFGGNQIKIPVTYNTTIREQQ